MEKDLVITLTVENQVKPEPYPVERSIFGMNIVDCMGETTQDGVLSFPDSPLYLDFSGVKEIRYVAIFSHRWNYNNRVVSASFPDLKYLGAVSIFYNAFYECLNLESISFPMLKVATTDAFSYAFAKTRKLKTATFPELEILTGFARSFNDSEIEEVYFPKVKEARSGGGSTFAGCKSLRVASFPLLEKLDAHSFNSMFEGCEALKTISFPSLITIPYNAFGSSTYAYAFRNSGLEEIHFRADMQATIEAMTGYSAKWGATNATIYFDL